MAKAPAHPFASALKTFKTASGGAGKYWSLKELARQYPNIEKLPVSIRIVLESVLRNCDGQKVGVENVEQLANWQPNAERTEEIPFVVTRVVLQDFTGVPLLADLAAMRSVAAKLGKSPKTIEPLVPVDLVVDHSVMVDYYGTPKALDLNMKLEFQRNNERYQFMKWGMQAFDTFGVVPPGFGIVHQVNLEYFARGVYKAADDDAKVPTWYPDSLVGTDSHTTMINGIGVVGWGVGGIEAEAAMLGQPVYMLTPDVVGFELTGKLREGVTATDLVLYVTAILRTEKVVGKFVEFFGPGAASIAVPDRATIGNMAPEYGATMGFFPVDEMTVAYFKGTGRTDKEIERFEAYYKAQGLFGMPAPGELNYTKVVRLDLGTVSPSLAGPKRPQDRIDLGHLSTKFSELYSKPNDANGFNQPADKLKIRYPLSKNGQGDDSEAPAPAAGAPRQVVEMVANRSTKAAAHVSATAPVAPKGAVTIGNGDVLIAAITSCTNTSNPSVMLAAGLLAKKAVEAGLTVKPHVKTSLAPGSRIVTEYLEKAGLLPYLEQLGFYLAGYGCTTCIGNAGDLTAEINEVITENNLVAAAVLSGNRNFEARIHPNLKANFLASPPLVVAFAIAGNVMTDLMTEPVGKGKHGKDVYLGDIWPTPQEIDANLRFAMNAKAFRANYDKVKTDPGKFWSSIKGTTGQVYDWPTSTYIAEPPFFEGFKMKPAATNPGFSGARVMALFGDSITTDHISPAGSIKESSPAGVWLKAHGVPKADFNSYGSRRGNHEIMMRGTFANVRIKNLMLPPDDKGTQEEGGLTLFQPGNEKMFIYDAAMKYIEQEVPTVVFGGEEYGTGSSRDWAAKGTQLLGIKAVVARSFERIHRANLVGMGVLPLQFRGADSWQSLGLTGHEKIDVVIEGDLKPQMDVKLVVHRPDGTHQEATVRLRIDTPIEVDYYKHGGILPFVLRQLLAA
ncbi:MULTISPECIES: aconitate hydratase [unclassified Variovorax]|uniref:aconitate hydratase n=1 Tax=unclassified Variovorax TaxID=663243 RepID=UPI002577AD7D|nr:MULTISPECIES: aconitate hydratase [unclassified Variovorax]MDM0090458.1 aconitate hydratase [Variovorax sp. J22G40]MDM0147877.1 aconitate hydratase [Variovorax sp. J2P1-31]